MNCKYCGREMGVDCTCLKTNPVNKWEAGTLVLAILGIPFMAYSQVYLTGNIFEVSYSYVGNMILIVLVFLITILQLILGRQYLALFFGCHQHIDQTFKVFGKALPLCSRHTGIYIGIFTSLILTTVLEAPFFVYIILGIPMIVDVVLEQKYKKHLSNGRRFFTGLLFGSFVVFIFVLYNVLAGFGVETFFELFYS